MALILAPFPPLGAEGAVGNDCLKNLLLLIQTLPFLYKSWQVHFSLIGNMCFSNKAKQKTKQNNGLKTKIVASLKEPRTTTSAQAAVAMDIQFYLLFKVKLT